MFNISFIDKPSAPEGPLEVSDIHEDHVTLKWNPSKDDGGSPIDNYVVEKLDINTGRWVPAIKVTGADNECVVDGLNTGKLIEKNYKNHVFRT